MTQPDVEPVFAAPWEARVFALQQKLLDAGVFTGSEWAARLGAEIAHDDCRDDAEGSAYYRYWLRALEGLMADKGLASSATVEDLARDWQNAAARTPHGRPITLEEPANRSK